MVIELKQLSKTYGKDANKTYALNNVDLTIRDGEMVAIMGPSGSGKSTLLNLLGFIDKPTNGEYILNSINTSALQGNKLAKIRNKEIGFVFQYFALMKEFTVLDNVILPLIYRKMPQKERVKKGILYLEKMGIGSHKDKKISELSGGQQQRVAIARALIGEPSIILADEPTGALDQKTGKDIIKILKDINKQGKTVIIVTHDINVANSCDRIITIIDGKIV